MKFLNTLFAAVFLLAAISCKRETASAGAKPDTPATTPATEAAKPKPPSMIEDAVDMKNSLQGKWKSATEPGVVYHIQGDQLERIVDGKPETTTQLTFSTSCAMGCGNIDKKYGRSGSAGCLTLSGKDANTCYWVISYAKDQFDFIRMNKPGATPESWVKM